MSVFPSAAERLVGGRYLLEEPIGRGGMGEVWRASHTALNSRVAIKFLLGKAASDEATRKRFLTEAQVTAKLKTRHAVQVFDFGITDDGRPYLVMELLEGETLDQRIQRDGRIEIGKAVRILRLAARALERAHLLGIVHRDFKPENIFVLLDEEGHDDVKVVDFGIAKLIGELEADIGGSAIEHVRRNPLSTFTRTGSVVGTPYYMAPEQVKNAASVGPPADIWAFGVVAYECITGCRPFDGDDVETLFRRILKAEFPPARHNRPDIPPAFEEWFRVACATDPAQRFPDAQIAAATLAAALGSPSAFVASPVDSEGKSTPRKPSIDSSDDKGETGAGRKKSGVTTVRALAATVDAQRREAPALADTRQSATRSKPSPPPPSRTDVGAAPGSSRKKKIVALGVVVASFAAVLLGAFRGRSSPDASRGGAGESKAQALATAPSSPEELAQPPAVPARPALGADDPTDEVHSPPPPASAVSAAPKEAAAPTPSPSETATSAVGSAAKKAPTPSAKATSTPTATPSAAPTTTAPTTPSAGPKSSAAPKPPSPFQLPDLGL